jgi:hypothetical protein
MLQEDYVLLFRGLWQDADGEVVQLSNPNKLKGSKMQSRRSDLRQEVMLQEDYVLHKK